MKIVAIIQARMGSTRLPGKVMKQICGKTVLFHVINRVKACQLIDEIVVATTDSQADDVIVQEAVKSGVQSFRGSEDNVLDRYYKTAKKSNADIVVRVTADNPLVDPVVMSQMLQLFLKNLENGISIDYLSNNLKGRTYPYGLDIEIMTVACLTKAFMQADSSFEKEHVTPYIREHPGLFSMQHYSWNRDFSHYRWTIDTEEDFQLISQVFEDLYEKDENFGTEEVLTLLDRKPELISINAHVQQKTR